jgi:hypothetical protein
MLNHHTVLALFKDTEDESLCNPLLTGIPGVIRIMAGSSLALTLENLKRTGIEPRLTILSGRLYPEERPNLVATVRRLFPATEFLLVTSVSDPFPPLQRLAMDRVRHLTINPVSSQDDRGEEAKTQFQTAVTKLVEGCAWEIADYLKQGTSIHAFDIASSTQKEELIAMVEQAIRGDIPDIDLLRQKGALLADEMLENAMYGAPQGEDGNKLYRKGEERVVRSEEKIVFRFGFDGETLAMEVADGWGSLSPELVLEHLARKQDGSDMLDHAGGRGLFIIWRFLDHFHVSISPGRQTVIGGRIKAVSPLDPESPKGFHISTYF